MEIADLDKVSSTVTPRNETMGSFRRVDKSLTSWYLQGPVRTYISIGVMIINILFLVILKKSETKSLVSTLLSAIAGSDLLTSLTGIPEAMFLYMSEDKSFYPYTWCYIFAFTSTLPVMCHTLSIWFTLLLGMFRYISVCHPIRAVTWCRDGVAYRTMAGMVILSVALFATDFFKYKIEPKDVWNEEQNRFIPTCMKTYQDWMEGNRYTYSLVQNIIRIIFIQIVPTAGLLFITLKLIMTMRKADKTRKYLTSGINPESTDSKRTNILLIVVLFLFLIVEIPFTFLFSISAIESVTKTRILTFDNLVFTAVCNNTVLLTCGFNFCIYCVMGRKFRSIITIFFQRCRSREMEFNVQSTQTRSLRD